MFRKSSHSQTTVTCVEVDTDFTPSSRCDTSACVEVAYTKASISTGNGNCVEVGRCSCPGGVVLVRDSKDKTGPVLSFNATAWTAFVAGIRAGEFDLAKE